MRRTLLLLVSFILLGPAMALAQVQVGQNGTLSGTVFSDLYWIPLNHNNSLEGKTGFWFRRIYFTYDHTLSEHFTARLRLEMASPGDFESDEDMAATVKDAYLKWHNEHHAVYAGISKAPTWALIEEIWGYRSVEKTALDVYDFGSSRDFGIAAKGKLGPEYRFGYHVMIGNGNGEGPELNKGKKLMGALSYRITEQLVIQAYGDWNSLPGGDHYTLQGFIGWEGETVSLGALYAWQLRKGVKTNGTDRQLDLVSAFANVQITETLAAYGRVDHLFGSYVGGEDNDYLPFNSKGEPTLMIAGVDFTVGPDIHLMPNIEAIVYGETPSGNNPEMDLIPRLTLFYSF